MLLRLRIALLISLAMLLLAAPTLALSGPEVMAVAESGTAEQFGQVLAEHRIAQLFRVRQGGRGLLHVAVTRGEPFWTQALSAGWPITEEKGWTPQHECALSGLDKAMAALLAAKAPVNVKEPVNGGTPLHVAAFNGRIGIVKLLVQAGAKVNARDNEGWTPLSQARDQGFPQIVEWLKTYGATR